MCSVSLIMQEIQPSGPNGPTVTVGDYVRDLLLEQVSELGMVLPRQHRQLHAATACSNWAWKGWHPSWHVGGQHVCRAGHGQRTCPISWP